MHYKNRKCLDEFLICCLEFPPNYFHCCSFPTLLKKKKKIVGIYLFADVVTCISCWLRMTMLWKAESIGMTALWEPIFWKKKSRLASWKQNKFISGHIQTWSFFLHLFVFGMLPYIIQQNLKHKKLKLISWNRTQIWFLTCTRVMIWFHFHNVSMMTSDHVQVLSQLANSFQSLVNQGMKADKKGSLCKTFSILNYRNKQEQYYSKRCLIIWK